MPTDALDAGSVARPAVDSTSAASLDAQAQRPPGRPAGFQRWRQLLFLHWEVDAKQLAALLPERLKVDTFEGRAYVGVVPFTMRDVSPWWSPAVPGVSHFHELNVRTYVLHNGVPGVWFFSLEAAGSIAVIAARIGWSLPYHKASMDLREHDGAVTYQSRRRWPKPTPAEFSAKYRVTSTEPFVAKQGTLTHFLVERYVLFAQRGDDPLRLGRVHHQPYPLLNVSVDEVNDGMVEAAGLTPLGLQYLAHYSEGVDVDVYALTAC